VGSLSEGDILLFYVTQPVGGIIGHGVLRTKFKQNRPLWPQELSEGKLIWPLRFEFDVEWCLPPDTWTTNKLVSKLLWARAGFQLLGKQRGEELISSLRAQSYSVPVTKVPLVKEVSAELATTLRGSKEGFPSHDELN